MPSLVSTKSLFHILPFLTASLALSCAGQNATDPRAPALPEPLPLTPHLLPPLQELLPDGLPASCDLPGPSHLSSDLQQLLDSSCLPITGSALSSVLARHRQLRIDGDRVKVSIYLDQAPGLLRERSLLRLNEVPVEVLAARDRQVNGWVEIASLARLAQAPGVRLVESPLPIFQYATSQAVSHTNALEAHGDGISGEGLHIGILDGGFTDYETLLGTELPSTVTALSFPSGYGLEGSEHGTAVAETVHDMAPGADLTLIAYETDLDFCDAIDYLLTEGADIITTSTGTTWGEPLDGRGIMAQCAKTAVDAGVPFTAASGNHGDRHYYGAFSGTTWHNFGTGNILYLNVQGTSVYTIPAGSPITLTLAWDDWGVDPSTPTSDDNYDLYLMVYSGGTWYVLASSTTVQGGSAFPREAVVATAPITSYYGVAIQKVSSSRNANLNLFGLEYNLDPAVRTSAYSTVSPCVGQGVTCVGAVHWGTSPTDTETCDNIDNDSDGNTDENCIEDYSSRGPAIPDELTGISQPKVDIVSSDCVDTVTYGTYASTTGFCGTSSATPHTAGQLALYLEMYGDPELALQALSDKAWDMGTAGYDSDYGDGFTYTDCDLWYADTDSDTFGDPSSSIISCSAPEGYVADNTDCNDALASVHPGATETCNEIDDDCDSSVDEGLSTSTWYLDADADNHGLATSSVAACAAPEGYVASSDDCDDTRATVYPGADEYCNELDDDCDSRIDEYGAVDAPTRYRDLDNDGWGNTSRPYAYCTVPTGYSAVGGDCADGNPDRYPGATESCNGLDDDCDSEIDEGAGSTWYQDSDSDTYGNASATLLSCAQPSGYVADSTDCDDGSATVYPSAAESCNGIDDDCDTEVDEGVKTTWYADSDSDTYGDATSTTLACTQPEGHVAANTDCDDSNAAVNPGATETCNDLDDDCDTAIDEDAGTPWYRDADSDTYGDLSTTTLACAEPSGFVADSTDCDDSSGAIHPGASESCNGLDDDCDSGVDEGLATSTWYPDGDSDSYGDMDTPTERCAAPAGYVADGTDCDDAHSAAYPGGTELCDGLDNDCDGTIDDGHTLTTWYLDADTDTHGLSSAPISACDAPPGYVSSNDDCNDSAANAYPGAGEYCDGIDNDCDGKTDELGALDAPTRYRDIDGDNYGNSTRPALYCNVPTGYAAVGGDCADGDPSRNPGVTETCNGIDDDCDAVVDDGAGSTWYQDADLDAYGVPAVTTVACTRPTGYSAYSTDCNDADATIHPGASETCNTIDDDCDGRTDEVPLVGAPTWYRDYDSDGWGNTTRPYYFCTQPTGYVAASGDCADSNPARNPGASEICNSLDDDCDRVIDDSPIDGTAWYPDVDLDSFGDETLPTVACSAPSGLIANGTDCDDSDELTFPGATESCDDIDNDCDDLVDELGVCCSDETWSDQGYSFCDYDYTWLQAQALCAELGMDFVAISSAEENTWLSSTAATWFGTGSWYIGLSDIDAEGTFLWDNGETLGYTSWLVGQPDDPSGTEDCVASDSSWSDLSCDTTLPFVCEEIPAL